MGTLATSSIMPLSPPDFARRPLQDLARATSSPRGPFPTSAASTMDRTSASSTRAGSLYTP